MLVICKNCGREFDKKPWQIRRTNNNNFCTRTCAAIFNSQRTDINRRKPEGNCITCNKKIKTKNKYCKSCLILVYPDWDTVTLEEVSNKRNYQKHSRIRTLARAFFIKNGGKLICQNCGYSKHVDICHKKAIKDFSLDTPINVINSLDNLLALCKNCHWEYDKGRLKLNI